MCGIGGFSHQSAQSPALVQLMKQALRQRGPDAQHSRSWDSNGQPVDPHQAATLALVHTRLAIIDPRPEADQPMGNEDGSVWISYNGEVYDWQADAAELKRQGLVFHTRSDTEFILRAYQYWGIGLLPRLRGKFALAILDLNQQVLWLITDRLGLKPLVYSLIDGNLAFASLVRALIPLLPRSQRHWSPAAIDAYLAHRSIPCPHSIFSGINRLPAGHYARFDLRQRKLTQHRYWSLESAVQSHADSERSWEDLSWTVQLRQAIELRTVADRPVGLFLSGGIDSTVVASHLADSGHQDMRTFTAAFADSAFDESQQALRTARHLHLNAEIIAIPQPSPEDFRQIVADLDEPFADPGALPLWYLARAAATQVKVVLSGDGGDELLGGYKRYAQHLRSAWRKNRWKIPLILTASPEAKGWHKLLLEAGLGWLDAYSLRFSGFNPCQRLFLQPDFKGPLHYWTPPDWQERSPLEQLLAIDRTNVLPDYILRKSDLCSMCHGLELRAPLLDYRLVEAIQRLPPQARFTQPPKQLFRQVCPALDELGLFAAKKRGFNPPLGPLLQQQEWLSDLGVRLEQLTNGQIQTTAVKRLLGASNRPRLASDEQILQLLILAESLQQLKTLADNTIIL